MKNIKKLPKEFKGVGEVKGFHFKQIREHKNIYIYEVRRGSVHYEVFKAKIVPICLDFAKKQFSDTDFKEIYPTNEKFKFHAWAYENIEDAIWRLELIKM